MGKGATGLCSPQRQHEPDTTSWSSHANLTAGNSKSGSGPQGASVPNLSGLLNETNLAWCFKFLRKDAAPGADRVDVLDYRQELESCACKRTQSER